MLFHRSQIQAIMLQSLIIDMEYLTISELTIILLMNNYITVEEALYKRIQWQSQIIGELCSN